MVKKQQQTDGVTDKDEELDPVSTEVSAACARGLSGAARFLSQHHLMGPGARVEVLSRDHFVISSPDPKDPTKNGCVRHVRVTLE
jgi:hypothetical protein